MPSILDPSGSKPEGSAAWIRDPGSLAQGCFQALFLNFMIFLAGCLGIFILVGIVVIAGFGVLQFAWLGPMIGRYKRDGATESVNGVYIAAGITFLLSAACWGSIASPRR